jgi:site-specific DNA recombinase
LLGDLDRYYKQAAIEVKSKIVSSIFPEKLIFTEKKYRTPKINEVLALITSNINHLGIPKKQKAAKIDSLHHMASPGGIEPPL